MIYDNVYSIKARFLYSFFFNITRGGVNFVASLLIVRFLSPSEYGLFAFLLTSFQAVLQLFDQGASSAFYTFLCSKKLYSMDCYVYLFWILMQLILAMIFFVVFKNSTFLIKIWHTNKLFLIFMGFLSVFVQQVVWWSVAQLGESKRLSIFSQGASFVIAIVYLLIILFLKDKNKITISSLYEATFFIYILSSIIMFIIFSGTENFILTSKKHICDQIFQSVRRYWEYCRPLFLMSFITVIYTFLLPWMLMHYNGDIEQGYFQASSRFSVVSLLVTTAALRIFWKEMVVLSEDKNPKAEVFFYIVLRSIFTIGAIFSCFFVLWAKELTVLVLGSQYANAWIMMAIMFFYPVHQSVGQVLGASFSATRETRVYAILSNIFMIMSIITGYFLLAPIKSHFLSGLHLGGLGLCLNLLIIQIISVNVGLYVYARLQKWDHKWFFQLIIASSLFFLAFLVKKTMMYLIFEDLKYNMIITIISSFLIYLLLVSPILFIFSKVFFGFSRERLKFFLQP